MYKIMYYTSYDKEICSSCHPPEEDLLVALETCHKFNADSSLTQMMYFPHKCTDEEAIDAKIFELKVAGASLEVIANAVKELSEELKGMVKQDGKI